MNENSAGMKTVANIGHEKLTLRVCWEKLIVKSAVVESCEGVQEIDLLGKAVKSTLDVVKEKFYPDDTVYKCLR